MNKNRKQVNFISHDLLSLTTFQKSAMEVLQEKRRRIQRSSNLHAGFASCKKGYD